ncbi:hypothetical protein [Jannaschia seohaensis]|uniref:Uncharacterized protein n=1 Tax=Jannaschia seohaensis TaxID=475081 RepID=A0A2Y9APG0_9RHOB|nr:hypothetical protein [Jannaschia seohaensis]PWJ20230.1 hypothetical protein BCF38_10345 [Jannaschia seohaensis]SSA44229.1 hypothetical protein SAMN05421539_10345 [Jannaschia seohaensis]
MKVSAPRPPSSAAALTGIGVVALVMYWLREYILHIVQAGQIAIMVDLIDTRPLPKGRSQPSNARAMVRARLVETGAQFAADQIVKGVLRAITGLILAVFTLLPFRGMRQLLTILRAFLNLAVGVIGEVMLAHAMRTRAADTRSSARDAAPRSRLGVPAACADL